MVGIADAFQLLVLSVYRQRILRQIVGSYAEKVHFLRQLIGNHSRRRRLDHNAKLRLPYGIAFLCKLLLHHLHNLPDPLHLIHGYNHGEHDRQLSMGSRTVERPKLGNEYLLPVQTDTDRPITERRIFFRLQPEIIHLLIRPDIHRADHNLPAFHLFKNSLIACVLLLFRRKILPAQIEKFASEKADSSGICRTGRLCVLHIANIGKYVDPFPALSNIVLSLQFLKGFQIRHPLVFPHNLFGQYLLLGLHQKLALKSVHHTALSVQLIRKVDTHVHQRRQIHASCQNGRVGISRSFHRHKAKDFLFVKLHRLAGRQILRHQNHRFLRVNLFLRQIQKNADHSLGDIPDIRRASSHILVIHRRKQLCELRSRLIYRIHCIITVLYLSRGRGQIVFILQKHPVYVKDSGMILSHVLQSLVIEFRQLCLRAIHGGKKPFLLSRCIRHLPIRHLNVDLFI